MSYCYNCNGTNARFKRYVYTGTSKNNKYTNDFYGYRFFCESCNYKFEINELNVKIRNRIGCLLFLIFPILFTIFRLIKWLITRL